MSNVVCSGDNPALAAKSLPVDVPVDEPDIDEPAIDVLLGELDIDVPDVLLVEPDIVVEPLVGIVLVVCPTAVKAAPVARANERATLKIDFVVMT